MTTPKPLLPLERVRATVVGFCRVVGLRTIFPAYKRTSDWYYLDGKIRCGFSAEVAANSQKHTAAPPTALVRLVRYSSKWINSEGRRVGC